MDYHIDKLLDTPLILKTYELYKKFYDYVTLFPKKDKYTLGTKCETYILTVLELLIAASNTSKDKKLILVYGDMKELGETEVQRHKDIGKVIEDLKADFVILVGPLSVHTQSSLKKTKNVRVETAQEVLSVLKPLITKSSLILVKGARSLKLEELVAKL